MKPSPFIADLSELDKSNDNPKLQRCPHCSKTGELIRHGFLRGYAESALERVLRARRFFCSNRHRRKGCGRTFSIFAAKVLRRMIITTSMLSLFIEALFEQPSIKKAWEATGSKLSLNCAYRLRKRIALSIPRIRCVLTQRGKPPPTDDPSPLKQTWNHLKEILGKSNPVAAFQLQFQVPFFSN